ncbi:MAG: peptidyl-prolyl cis-trans isomerase, partial [Desulfobacula sp.]|nr:peptidyl-prolyl cis-trans isomerase [Desulfobacula sp.]
AAEYSIDKKSKNRKGDIGSRALSKFRKDWQPVISSLETKKVSGPHKIRDAYYIFKLTNKTEPHQYSFEEKKPYVKNDLLYTRYREEWQKTYDSLKKEYKVKIDEKNLAAFLNKEF